MIDPNVPTYSLPDVALIVRRHAHDVRNALNGMELELTLLDHESNRPGTREAIARLRQAVSEIGRCVQGLSGKYGTEDVAPILALQISERWKADARHVAPDASIEWHIKFSDEPVAVESGFIRTLLLEILDMAIRIGGTARLQTSCRRELNRALFEVSAVGSGAASEIISTERVYWVALQRLAERNQAVLEPSQLGAGGFPLRLWLPLQESAI
jgi:hypothetical protein